MPRTYCRLASSGAARDWKIGAAASRTRGPQHGSHYGHSGAGLDFHRGPAQRSHPVVETAICADSTEVVGPLSCLRPGASRTVPLGLRPPGWAGWAGWSHLH